MKKTTTGNFKTQRFFSDVTSTQSTRGYREIVDTLKKLVIESHSETVMQVTWSRNEDGEFFWVSVKGIHELTSPYSLSEIYKKCVTFPQLFVEMRVEFPVKEVSCLFRFTPSPNPIQREIVTPKMGNYKTVTNWKGVDAGLESCKYLTKIIKSFCNYFVGTFVTESYYKDAVITFQSEMGEQNTKVSVTVNNFCHSVRVGRLESFTVNWRSTEVEGFTKHFYADFEIVCMGNQLKVIFHLNLKLPPRKRKRKKKKRRKKNQ
jgi:hypothetical protein